jgi:hypothetical protein
MALTGDTGQMSVDNTYVFTEDSSQPVPQASPQAQAPPAHVDAPSSDAEDNLRGWARYC